MKRSMSLVAAVLLSGGVAYADTVVSYCGGGNAHGGIKITDIPAEGFVLTDIIISRPGEQRFRFWDGAVEVGELVLEVDGNLTTGYVWHWESGISLSGSAELWVQALDGGGSGFLMYTVSGYIPSPSSTVPAVGELGMALMAAAIVVVGAIVFTRMKQRQAA